MKIQYQIMELDEHHLKKADTLIGTQDRVCFRPAKLDNLESHIQDSMEDALKVIERNGNDYTEYTVIPRIYMTDWDED